MELLFDGCLTQLRTPKGVAIYKSLFHNKSIIAGWYTTELVCEAPDEGLQPERHLLESTR
jgi:hypothetical protein